MSARICVCLSVFKARAVLRSPSTSVSVSVSARVSVRVLPHGIITAGYPTYQGVDSFGVPDGQLYEFATYTNETRLTPDPLLGLHGIPERVAAVSAAVCEECMPGSFSAVAGNYSCVWCKGGTYSRAGVSACTECVAGKFLPLHGPALLTALLTTPLGNETQLCRNCTRGTWSHAGAPVCTKCRAGKFSPALGEQAYDESVCASCLPGSFSDAGASACSFCGAGHFALGGASACSACDAGKASPLTGLLAVGPWVCKECSLGHSTNNLTGAAACTACAAGAFAALPGMGACELCPPGQYQDSVGETTCKVCPINTWTNRSGSPECSLCPPGKFSRPGAEKLELCREGEITVTPEQAWGDIVEEAEDFVLVFLQPGYYTGYCNLRVRALKLEGIMGKNFTTIDCAQQGRHFHIQGSRNLSLVGLTFVGGVSEGDGGCVHVAESGVHVRECDFKGCRAEGSGGAFFVTQDSTIDFADARFLDSSGGRHGGVIHLSHNTSGEISDVVFENSQAVLAGGALYVAHESSVTVARSNFSGGERVGAGFPAGRGAVRANGGGAVAVVNASVARFRDVNFSDCSAIGGLIGPGSDFDHPDEEYGVAVGGGVAVVSGGSELELVLCNISAAQALQDGGAVRLGHACSLRVSHSSFHACDAAGLGGVMRLGPLSHVHGTNNLFERGRSGKGGGVIAFASRARSSLLTDSRFSFDNLGCLGCPAMKLHTFAICLDHNQALRLGHDVYVLPPCQGIDCAFVQCWGMEHMAWRDSCLTETGGWRVSSQARCGSTSWPWTRFEMPDVHWSRVEAQQQLEEMLAGGTQDTRALISGGGGEGRDTEVSQIVPVCALQDTVT